MVSRTAVKTRTGSKGTSVKNRRRSIKSKDEWKVRQRFTEFYERFCRNDFRQENCCGRWRAQLFCPVKTTDDRGKNNVSPVSPTLLHGLSFYRRV